MDGINTFPIIKRFFRHSTSSEYNNNGIIQVPEKYTDAFIRKCGIQIIMTEMVGNEKYRDKICEICEYLQTEKNTQAITTLLSMYGKMK